MSVKHKKHSTATGSTDPSKVHPSDWNDEHVNADGTPVTSLRRVGPFRINWDTEGVNTSYVVLMPLEAGMTILRVWTITNDFTTNPELSVNVTVDVQTRTTPPTEPIIPQEIYAVDGFDPSHNSTGREVKDLITADVRAFVGQVPDDGEWDLAAYVYLNGAGDPVSGSLDIYALIADPA